MSCHRALSRAELATGLGSTFVSGEYKKHRERVLLDRERAMLPATQNRLESYRRCRELETAIGARTTELRALKAQIREMQTRVAGLQNRIEYDKAVIARARERAYEPPPPTRRARAAPEAAQETAPEAEPPRVVCGCPVAGCNGFVVGDACGVCGTAVCTRCHATVGDGHECDPGAVETIRALKRETKPCPRCHVPIYKSSGCYQMFCTQCQCVFDWANGREIKTGPVHNPHYFDWLRARGGAAGAGAELAPEIPCGGWRGAYAVLHALPPGLPVGSRDALTRRVRTAAHLEAVDMRALEPRDVVRANTVLRLRFLNRELTEAQFKTALQRAEKKRARDDELRQILDTYVTVVQTTIGNLGGGGGGGDGGLTFGEAAARATARFQAEVREACAQLDALDAYVTGQIMAVNAAFGSKARELLQNFVPRGRPVRAT